MIAGAICFATALTPAVSSAEGLLDLLFGGGRKPQPQSSFFDKIFSPHLQPPSGDRPDGPSPERGVSSGPSFCVRSCDGKYFPLRRGVGMSDILCKRPL